MSDRTQDLKNLRAVATACKNYVDATKEQILWQVGQYDITTEDDNTTAYQKVVPTGATRAKIKSIGGMSYKSENLLYTLGNTGTTNGLTFTIDNGNINVDGTPTEVYAGRSFSNYFADNSLKGTYTLKNYTNDFPSGMFVRLTFIKDGSRNYSLNINTSVQTSQFTFDGTETSFRFEYAFQSETLTSQNGNIKPMIVSGSTAPSEFKEGFTGIRDSVITSIIGAETKTIPNEVKALSGYGWGINENCYNYIDFENKKFIQKVGSYTFTGSETLTEYTRSSDSKKTYAVAINGRATTTNVLFENLSLSTATTMNTMEDNSYRGATDTTSVIFYSTSYQTSASMLSFLNGKTIYYELATPIETDISQYIDDSTIVDVESGGSLEFTNTYGQAVPSNITYRIEVAK